MFWHQPGAFSYPLNCNFPEETFILKRIAGGIDFLESIPGLIKCLRIRPLECLEEDGWYFKQISFNFCMKREEELKGSIKRCYSFKGGEKLFYKHQFLVQKHNFKQSPALTIFYMINKNVSCILENTEKFIFKRFISFLYEIKWSVQIFDEGQCQKSSVDEI